MQTGAYSNRANMAKIKTTFYFAFDPMFVELLTSSMKKPGI